MKIASFLDDISISQNSYSMIREFNKLSSNKVSTCCFYHNLAPPPINMNFAIINSYYLPYWDGHIFATSLQTANTLKKINSVAKKYLYLYDLEWLRSAQDFEENMKILRDPSIKIVARSIDHADMIQNYANIKVKDIMSDWQSSKLLEIVNG